MNTPINFSLVACSEILYKVELRTALAPQLPEETLIQLINRNAKQTTWPADIFTCRPDKYLRYGGVWITDLEQGQTMDTLIQESFQGTPRLLARILLYLWSYAAYLFVPPLWVVNFIIGPITRNIRWRPAIPLFRRLRNPLPFQLSMIRYSVHGTIADKLFILLLLPFLPLGIAWTIIWFIGRFLAPYNALAVLYTLPRDEATSRILECISADCTMEKLMSLRPLMQRSGGAELRMTVAHAYTNAQTWWKQRFTYTELTDQTNE